MDLNNLISFLTASVLLTLMPGPDNMYVLIESVTKGYKTGIAIATGLVSGIVIHTLIASTGLSLFFLNSDIAFKIIRIGGILYLLYLAFLAVRENVGNDQYITFRHENKNSFWRLFRRGFLMNVMNPKVTLFFIAFLPQFITVNGLNVSIQMIIMGFLFMIQAIIIFIMISVLAGKLSMSIQNKKFWLITKCLKVAILISIAVGLLFLR
jgi:threonine/homoserine/homoserine lactone efflux protein